ncbi:ammonium transporter Rh type B isoform X2 [Amyelois transitella]|uniref:ammonium transporter Rh type B isoform X2 n=1 Tax=Amyelois transitella TaxID=680683 RepID=UPI0029900446|nr:ammonium transporter Rh type B isoform X2 [Amyelois transitella]
MSCDMHHSGSRGSSALSDTVRAESVVRGTKLNEMVLKGSAMKYLPLLGFQLVLMALFFIFTTYGTKGSEDRGGFEGTHVMIFIGFGFLMTFLKKYCYSALGFNWFLAALVVQWALLCQNFFHMHEEADIMAATVLITFGALLGITSGFQLLVIAVIETAIGCANIYLVGDVFKAADVGGSIAIHAYGAYFGLGVSSALKLGKKQEVAPAGQVDLNGPSYVSDVTAMIGSIFLWIYWPSFNSGLTGTDVENQRAVINTYLSLASATVVTFILSAAVSHQRGKFDMVHIQNSTLAGGVAIGSVCNMMVNPGGAIAVGIGAAVISVFGYRYLTPKLNSFGILDTCGVNNLHGMPAVYSGLLSILFASLATKDDYGETELHSVFEAMKDGRTASSQALYQFYALIATVAIASVSGFVTGLIVKLPMFGSLKEEEKYNDEPNWELP